MTYIAHSLKFICMEVPTFRASNDSSREERTYDANFTDAEDPIQICPEFRTGGLLVCWFKQKFPVFKFTFHFKKVSNFELF